MKSQYYTIFKVILGGLYNMCVYMQNNFVHGRIVVYYSCNHAGTFTHMQVQTCILGMHLYDAYIITYTCVLISQLQ